MPLSSPRGSSSCPAARRRRSSSSSTRSTPIRCPSPGRSWRRRNRGASTSSPRGDPPARGAGVSGGLRRRALDAVMRAISEARCRVGNSPPPIVVVGAGRGGKLGLEIAARTPGLFAAVGSVGGIFDPGPGCIARGCRGPAGRARLPRSLHERASCALQGDAAGTGEHGEARRQAEVGRVAGTGEGLPTTLPRRRRRSSTPSSRDEGAPPLHTREGISPVRYARAAGE